MSDRVQQLDIGALITPRLAVAPTSLTAGGSGDAAAVTPIGIQRSAIGMPLSVELAIGYTATLAATKTLSIGTVKVRHSSDGTTFTDFATFTDPGVVATGPSGGATVTGQVTDLKVNLAGAKDYVAFVFTPDLSASSTDTAVVTAFAVFGGADRLPAA